MRRRFALFALLFAWLCANGAVLQGLQTFAWLRMIDQNARIMPWAQAVETALDGSTPCGLCRIVEQTEQKQKSRPLAPAANERIVLICQTAPRPLVIAPAPDWPDLFQILGPTRPQSVLLTPPRV